LGGWLGGGRGGDWVFFVVKKHHKPTQKKEKKTKKLGGVVKRGREHWRPRRGGTDISSLLGKGGGSPAVADLGGKGRRGKADCWEETACPPGTASAGKNRCHILGAKGGSML